MALAAKRYFCLKGAEQMNYQNEWLLLEAEDEIDEVEHRPSISLQENFFISAPV